MSWQTPLLYISINGVMTYAYQERTHREVTYVATGNRHPVGSRRRNACRNASRAKKRRSRTRAPLSILMVIDQFNIGGTETHVLSLTRELLKQGNHVVVAGKYGRLLSRFTGLGATCYEIDFVTEQYEYDVEMQSIHETLLDSILEKENIDLVHGHQFPSGYLAYQATVRKKIPFAFTFHGRYYDEMLLRKMQNIPLMISVSPAVQQDLREKGYESTLIANGIEAQDYRAYRSPDSPYRTYIRRKLRIPEETKLIMYAGRLSWEKADIGEEIIQAITQLKQQDGLDVHLLVVGGGNRETEIQSLARQQNESIGATFIHCTGEVDNIHTFYAASDVVIGTGRVLLEAMACCRPVIAAGSRGYGGIIEPDRYAVAWSTWFGDHDTEWFLTRKGILRDLREVIHMSGSRLKELVNANLQYVQGTYPIARISQETVQLYEKLVRQAPHSMRVRAASKMNNRI